MRTATIYNIIEYDQPRDTAADFTIKRDTSGKFRRQFKSRLEQAGLTRVGTSFYMGKLTVARTRQLVVDLVDFANANAETATLAHLRVMIDGVRWFEIGTSDEAAA